MFRCLSKHPPPLANFVRHFHQVHPLRAAQRAKSTTSKGSLLPKPKASNPLAQKVWEGFGGKESVSLRRGDTGRINIVSPELCDHAIERLAPSLEKHKGCDIIDLNPGACVWSSKLHQHLKPRLHLLVEPDIAYEKFYDPLLQEKDSTYKLLPKHGLLWSTLNSLGKHLPNQELLLPGDLRQDVPNNTLLFTANLGHRFPKIYGFRSLSQLFAHQMMSACRNHSVFQKYGLIRMLLWVDDREKTVLIPRNVGYRSKFSVEAEITFENIVDVASSDSELSVRMRRREHLLQLEGARRVAEQMQKDGIKVPDGRAGLLHLDATQEQGEPSMNTPATLNPFTNKPFIMELEKLEARFERGEFTAVGEDGRLLNNPEYLRMMRMRHRRNYFVKQTKKLDDSMAMYDDIVAKEESLKNLPAEEANIGREAVKKIWEEFREDQKRFHFNSQAQFIYRLDDRHLFNRDPPVLHWDRRTCEPLVVRPDEFYPEKELALLDLQPRALSPIFKMNNNYDYFDYILATFFQAPTQSVETALESLAPGAFDWIVPECPSLTNVSKGGFSDLGMLRVRALSAEQWKEILTAWVNWPFRLSDEQVVSRLGSSNDAEEEDIVPDEGASYLG